MARWDRGPLGVAANKVVLAEKPEKQSASERLRAMNATEHQRITFGKSGIHGWGLMAKCDIKVGVFALESPCSLLTSCFR